MNEIRFIDLFSGIGGFRLGLERAGSGWGIEDTRQPTTASLRIKERRTIECLDRSSERFYHCVWSCDNNKYANQVYAKQFGETNHYTDDIRGVNPEEIPDFDLLCAGFPCQSFSVAGKRKGFQDTRGTLFFEICRIAKAKRPSLLLLENVKGLLSHDRGRTFTIILQSLDELGYWVEWQVLNSKYFGVPQNRERVFIIGHIRGTSGREIFPITEVDRHLVSSQEETQGKRSRVWSYNTLPIVKPRMDNRGDTHLIANTLSERYYKDGSENLIYGHPRNYQRKGLFDSDEVYRSLRTTQRPPPPNYPYNEDILSGKRRVRRLTPIECEHLQSFPDNWTEGISDTQRYKCLGNAVTVNVIEFLGHKIMESLHNRNNIKGE